jgi:hypothetical protein
MLAKYGSGLCCAQKRKAKFDVQTSLEERGFQLKLFLTIFNTLVLKLQLETLLLSCWTSRHK